MATTGETHDEQLRRNVNELLQELRVAQAGVQILFGFLLAVTFTEPYLRAGDFQQTVHLITVLFAAAAIALLTAPAAWHRVLFRQGQRERVLRIGNRFALAGMACLAAAMTGTVLLITDVVLGDRVATALAALSALAFAVLWFVLPYRYRRE
ncbi:DUF6328 family protein [Actinokineospora sp.]|uniref:DUF6328 family protein n=1 Tax=Actinokineospora sp. TaxID=1872133 RepID=UPI004037EBF8